MTTPTQPEDQLPTGANPRRDAWFAIRGFYYQIQTTVQRWIHLAPRDVLQCESAEDIEVLRNAFVDGELRVERVLEQVKVRETLTLRSEAVISTIARYFESATTSTPPTLFRFITTAAPGRERGLQFPRSLPGMSAWNATRNLELDAAERADVEALAHKLFVDARKPADIDDALWRRFQGHMGGMTPQQFGSTFIARIEWATASADVSSLRQQLCSDAIALKLAGTERDAQMLVDLLVAHVFHFLTRPGLKRLTHEDLKHVAAQSLAPRDTALLRLFETLAEKTSQQLARIESASDQILGRVNEFGPALTTILQHVQGASAHSVDLLTRAIDEPPHAPALFVERTHLVAQIESQIQHSVLTAINGPAGMGKTMLALRVYRRWQRNRHWISLRGLARGDVRSHLHVQLALRATELTHVALVGDVISAYANGLGDGLLVIDELPNLTSDRRLADYVAVLIAAVESRSGHILVTTQAPVAVRLHEVVHTPISEWPVPRMAAGEVSDLMSQAQLPESLRRPQFVDTIVAITSGHPVLVAATIRYIQAQPSFDELRLVALLTGDSVKPVRVRTRQSLRDLLPDESARELLDRLSLTNGKFMRKVVFAVGDVEPRVPRCGELLQELNGVWLTQVGDDRFELSPSFREWVRKRCRHPSRAKFMRRLPMPTLKNARSGQPTRCRSWCTCSPRSVG